MKRQIDCVREDMNEIGLRECSLVMAWGWGVGEILGKG